MYQIWPGWVEPMLTRLSGEPGIPITEPLRAVTSAIGIRGAEIHIRPNGEVVRLGPPVAPQGGGRLYRPRVDYKGNPLSTHNTGEFVSPLPGRRSP